MSMTDIFTLRLISRDSVLNEAFAFMCINVEPERHKFFKSSNFEFRRNFTFWSFRLFSPNVMGLFPLIKSPFRGQSSETGASLVSSA